MTKVSALRIDEYPNIVINYRTKTLAKMSVSVYPSFLEQNLSTTPWGLFTV